MGVVASVIGDIVGGIAQNQQNQQTQAFEDSALGNQSTALGAAGSEAAKIAQGLPFQELLDVQKGGINTLKSQIGGLPNPAMFAKQLFGNATTNALETGVNTRTNNLAQAAGIYGGIGSQYGSDARAAMGVPQPNPWAALFTTLGGIGPNSSSPTQPGSPAGPNYGSTESQIGTQGMGGWGSSGTGGAAGPGDATGGLLSGDPNTVAYSDIPFALPPPTAVS